MPFSYREYENMIELLCTNGYKITGYNNWQDYEKCVIFRHDIDFSIEKAVEFAKIEKRFNVNSTYFTLVSSNFYNVFSEKSCLLLNEIISSGHEIGLHFDEKRYPESYGNPDKIKEKVLFEKDVLERAIGQEIKTLSMHRPSKEILASNLHIPGMINSYGNTFFKEFKYLSDSKCSWREPVLDIIKENKYNRLHILTHSFWYNKKEEKVNKMLEDFVNSASNERYEDLNDNFSDLKEILPLR
ncbi:MAG: hypothetical protein Q8882_00485 [Bacillota bacterium]|nr:hypothetical protein [Bacillota bacterium]